MKFTTWICLGALATSAALSTAACGTSGADLCSDKCDCEGCSGDDYQRCVDDDQRDQDDASSFGCEQAYDNLISCESDTETCDGHHHYDTSCGDEQHAFDDCTGPKKH
jgi:hypothetical protein